MPPPEPSPYRSVEDDQLFDSINADGVVVRRPFTQAEYDKRLSSLRTAMEHRAVGALVITSPDSMYYLTSFQTPGNPFSALIVPRQPECDMLLITRRLESSNARFRSMVKCVAYDEGETPEPLVTAYLDEIEKISQRIESIGYEAASPRLTVHSQRLLEELHPAVWQDCSDLVLSLRSIKSEAEVTFTRKAAELVIAGYKAALASLAPGVTETALAGEIQRAIMAGGAQSPPRLGSLSPSASTTALKVPD